MIASGSLNEYFHIQALDDNSVNFYLMFNEDENFSNKNFLGRHKDVTESNFYDIIENYLEYEPLESTQIEPDEIIQLDLESNTA